MSKKLIILKPIITEKSLQEAEKGKYTFKVSKNSSRAEIKKMVENEFKVKVVKVNTMNFLGKERKRGRLVGRTASWKKAVVTLKKGDKIELFEGK